MIIEIIEVKKNGEIDTVHPVDKDTVSVIMPSIDIGEAIYAARRMVNYAGMPMRIIIVEDFIRQGFVKTLNQVASKVESEFVAYVAQDALAGKNWLRLAYEKLTNENKSVFAFNDGRFAGQLATFGLVRKSFSEQFYGTGNIFYEGYHSHRADDELTLLANLHNQLAFHLGALMIESDFRTQRHLNANDVELFDSRKELLKNQFKNNKLT